MAVEPRIRRTISVDSDGSVIQSKDHFQLNEIEEATATVTYFGYETANGTWLIKKIDETTGTIFSWASINNNPLKTTYTLAWTGRAGLTYENYSAAM